MGGAGARVKRVAIALNDGGGETAGNAKASCQSEEQEASMMSASGIPLEFLSDPPENADPEGFGQARHSVVVDSPQIISQMGTRTRTPRAARLLLQKQSKPGSPKKGDKRLKIALPTAGLNSQTETRASNTIGARTLASTTVQPFVL